MSQKGSLQPPAASEALSQQQQQPCHHRWQADERQQLQRRAWEALAQYLFRVRCCGCVHALACEPPQMAACCACGRCDCSLSARPPTHALAALPPPQVRMLEGVACLPGVDTLLLLLLADLGGARQVAAFAAVPNEVDVAAVEQRLQVC